MRPPRILLRGVKHPLWQATKHQQDFVVHNDSLHRLEKAARRGVSYKSPALTSSRASIANSKLVLKIDTGYITSTSYSTLTRRPCALKNQEIFDVKTGGSRALSTTTAMFRTTLAHVTSLVKTGFKSQVRNRRIIDVADANKGQLRDISRKSFTHSLVQCESLKGLERPKLSTVSCNSQRYPNHSKRPALCAKAQCPISSFSTSQRTRPRVEGASGRRQHPSIHLNTKRPCTSSSTAQSTTEHIQDSEKISHIVKAKPATPALDSRPQLPKDNPTPKFAPDSGAHKFWSHRLYRSPDGKEILVHYCKTLESAETISKMFSDESILGLDIEWKANASAADGILKNVSLIQLASSRRIALFHIAMFRPARGAKDLVPPTLKRILESPGITKAGVSIKADCTRLRKYLGIDTRAIFELSHLYKLVKYSQSNPELINKRTVNLSAQVEEHFGIPLAKDVEVRCSDWASALDYSQVHYAAADPFACVCLFNTMNEKRMALDPVPPLPAHAELNLPIQIVHETPLNTEPEEVEVIEPIDNLLVGTKERS